MRELYDRLVRTHHAAVWSSAWRIVRNDADAHDVTQEVFLQVLRRGDEIARSDAPERVLRWLAAKTALAHLRAGRNRRRREEHVAMARPEHDDSKGGDSSGVRGAEQRELESAVRRCVAELPEELRLATTLRFAEGFTFAQLGECMGVAEPTAFERVKKAVAQLRARLTQLGHAAIAGEVEQWLARSEPIAVPSGLAASLLALPASGAVAVAAAGVTSGTAATIAATSSAKPFAWAAAAVVALLGGGAFLLQQGRAPQGSGERPAVAATSSVEADALPDETTAVSAHRSALERPAAALEATGQGDDRPDRGASRFTRGDFLRSSFGPPLASPEELAQPVATGELTGLVVDETGRAIVGARVDAHSSNHAGKGDFWSATGESDERGRFALRLAVIEPRVGQRYALTITHPDLLPHRTTELQIEADGSSDAGHVATQRVQAERAGDYTLAVTVRDHAGHPVEGAWVRVYRQLLAEGEAPPADPRAARERFETQEAWEGGVATDAAGLARVPGRRLGAKWLMVAARHGGRPDARLACNVDATGWNELQVTLAEARTIAGRVTLVAGGDVSALARPGAALLHALAADDPEPYPGQLDADGRFVIPGLPPGDYRVVCRPAEAAGLSPAAQFDVVAGAADVSLRLKANDASESQGDHLAEVHGRAVDAQSGAPVECSFECVAVPTADLATLRSDLFAALLAPVGAVQTMQQSELLELPSGATEPLAEALERLRNRATAASGGTRGAPHEYHATGLEAGTYVVRVRAAGYATALSEPLVLGERTLLRDVVVRVERGARAIGRVVDADGRPRARAVVVALAPSDAPALRLAALAKQLDADGRGYLWATHFCRTDAEGRFALEELAPGFDWQLSVLPIGGEAATTAPLRLAPGATHDLGEWRSDG